MLLSWYGTVAESWGDDTDYETQAYAYVLSPCVMGNYAETDNRYSLLGVIPTCAREPGIMTAAIRWCFSNPHLCAGTGLMGLPGPAYVGLSLCCSGFSNSY